jgi:RNA polymerase sigma-70 factor (ECF subfamily)
MAAFGPLTDRSGCLGPNVDPIPNDLSNKSGTFRRKTTDPEGWHRGCLMTLIRYRSQRPNMYTPNSTCAFQVMTACTQEDDSAQTLSLSQNHDGAATLEFDDVVERYYRPLYQFAFSLTRSEADASDLTQHTFYIWSIKGQQLRDISKVRAWLFTTMHRAFLQTKRREMRFPHCELDEDCELPRIAPEEVSRLDSADALDALNKIEDCFRAPLSLFYLEDCPYKEIALILDVPLGTVKSRIARGIARLQKILEPGEFCRQRAAA